MTNELIADGIYRVSGMETSLKNGAWVSDAGTYLVTNQTKLADIPDARPGDIAFTAGYGHIWQLDVDGTTWVELPKTAAGTAATQAAASATAAAGSASAAAASASQAQTVAASIPADYTDLSNSVVDLKSAVNDITDYYALDPDWVLPTSQRNYFNLGQVNGDYKFTVGTGAWASVQGWSNNTYDGTKSYDSSSFTEDKYISLRSADTSLYYRVVLGVSSGSISDAMRNGTVVYKKGTKVDKTLDVKNVPADAYSTGMAIDGVFDNEVVLPILWDTSTRGYVNLGLFNGVISAEVGTNVWVALQGYDTATYDGTKQYDSGTSSAATQYTINASSTGYYYRLVFGSSSGITDAVKANCKASYVRNDRAAVIQYINGAKPVNTALYSVMHGGTTAYPSNTLGLYKKAYKNNIMYWECDVRPCSDGYVLCHDNDIYNHAVTSEGETITQNTVLISASTVSALKEYKFGVITGQQANGVVDGFENETIPTLQEFLLLAKACGAYPVIEVKFSASEAQMGDICDIVKQCGMLDHTYILAYQDASTVVQYAIANGIKRLAIIINNGECSTSAVDTAYGYVSDSLDDLDDVIFDAAIANYSSSVAEYAASKGMKMGVWTVPTAVNMNTVRTIYKGYCTAFTTDKYDVGVLIRNDAIGLS